MQTFLPHPSFAKSAQCLDNKRLGKQRVEAYTILKILLEKRTKGGWVNHPATKMWRKYEWWLCLYYNVVLDEWIRRGFKNTMAKMILSPLVEDSPWPIWINEQFCSSHRAALLYKDPEHYGQFGWTEEPKINYIWPVK